MDLDWCLSCGRRIDSFSNSAYCSRQCQSNDGVSQSLYHQGQPPSSSPDPLPPTHDADGHHEYGFHPSSPSSSRSRWIDSGPDGILAWAREIPPNSPAGAPSLGDFSSFSSSSTSAPSPSSSSSHSAPSPRRRPPKLLSAHLPLPPTLCMTVPQPTTTHVAPKATPTPTPKQRIITTLQRTHVSPPPSLFLRRRESAESSSVTSTVTDSVATPSSDTQPSAAAPAPALRSIKPSASSAGVLGALATHVRSWVGVGAAAAAESTASTTKTILPLLPSSSCSTHKPIALFEGDEDEAEEKRVPWPPTTMPIQFATVAKRQGREEGWPVFPSSSSCSSPPLPPPPPRRTMRQAGVRADHPAYRTRGRKLSRAVF